MKVLLGGGGVCRSWDLSGGSFSHGWVCVLEGDCETLVSSSFLLPGHEVSTFALSRAPAMMWSLIQSKAVNWSWIEIT